MALVNAREATRDPYRGDPKCTGEKLVAWFQQVVVTHRGTRYFVKADWDTWIHTTRLEVPHTVGGSNPNPEPNPDPNPDPDPIPSPDSNPNPKSKPKPNPSPQP